MEGWSELYGRGVAVRREPGGYRVTPRTHTMWAARPQAVVRVVPDGDRSRLTGAIRPAGASRFAVPLPLTLVYLLIWAAVGHTGMAAFGVLLLVVSYPVERLRAHVRHDRLRVFLDGVVGP
jgi:hypothetical protein